MCTLMEYKRRQFLLFILLHDLLEEVRSVSSLMLHCVVALRRFASFSLTKCVARALRILNYDVAPYRTTVDHG